MHIVTHNYFGYSQLFWLGTMLFTIIFGYIHRNAQLFLATHIIMHNFFGNVRHYIVFLLMHIAKHNWFGLCTMLHTTFWLHTVLCTIVFSYTQHYAQFFG